MKTLSKTANAILSLHHFLSKKTESLFKKFGLGFLSAESAEVKKHLPWWYLLVASISQLISWVPWRYGISTFYRLKISGKENLKLATDMQKKYKSGVLFVSKHTGELDIMLVLTGINPFHYHFPMFYVAQHIKYYQSKDFGWRRFVYNKLTFNALGSHEMRGEGVTYDSLDENENYEEALKLHWALLKRNHSVCVYPEGKIPENGGFREPYGFAVHLAQTGAIIVPIAIVRKKHPKHFRTTICLRYGKPFRYSDIPKFDTINKKSEKYKKEAKYLLDKIAEEVKNVERYCV